MTWGVEQLGGSLLSRPVSTSWAPGRLDVFGIDTDPFNEPLIFYWWWPGPSGWGGPEPLVGWAGGISSAVSWGPDRLDVFGAGYRNELEHRWYEPSAPVDDPRNPPGWVGPTQLSEVPAYTTPAAVSWGPHRLDVFGFDPTTSSTQLLHWWWPGPPYSLAGLGWGRASRTRGRGGLSAVSWGPGRLDVFGKGPRNQLKHWWWDGGWGEPELLGGEVAGGPAAVAWVAAPRTPFSSGRLDVFAVGLAGQVQHWSWTGPAGWSSPELLPGIARSDPRATPGVSAVSAGAGRLDVFGFIPDSDGLQHWWWPDPAGWGGPEPLPGKADTAGVSAVSWGPGRLDVFARAGPSGPLSHWWAY